jgi:SEC-C motif domain protein
VTRPDAAPCPCGLPARYPDCCGRYHRGEAHAPTAEALMRSRFTAFALGDTGYLRDTWDRTTCPPDLSPDPGLRWTHLEIVHRHGGGLLDAEGTVQFRAHHEHRGQPGVLRERSRFRRVGGRWLYVDGT